MAAGRMGKPKPISMAAAMATGAPWAVVPSRKAEKQKPIRMAWMRLSLETDAMDDLMISKLPDSMIKLYMNTALKISQQSESTSKKAQSWANQFIRHVQCP